MPNLLASESSGGNSESTRNAEFAKALTGTSLVGHFTIAGDEKLQPQSERYELTSVKHLEGDQWLFVARIQYGDHDVRLPITLPIQWADDTPVITVNKLGLPGLGTYTARVMIYQDHYAGFWQGADHAGHMFGVIERGKPADSPQ